MTAKEWLMRGWKLNTEIDRLIEVRDNVKAKALSITSQIKGDVIQSTKDPHKFDRLTECEEALDAKIDKYTATVQEITEVISTLPDKRHRVILIDRYLLYKSWEQTAVDEGYNIRHIWRLHGEALNILNPLIQEKQNETLQV